MFTTTQQILDHLNSLSFSKGRNGLREIGQEKATAICQVRGGTKILAAKLGMASAGVLANAMDDFGWKEMNHRGNGGEKRGATSVKRKGSIPFKVAVATCKALGIAIDIEDFDPSDVSWEKFKLALDLQGNDWIAFLENRLKGEDAIAAFRLWYESNKSADEAEAKATPQMKARNKAINKMRELLKVFEECLWSEEFDIIHSAIESLEDLN